MKHNGLQGPNPLVLTLVLNLGEESVGVSNKRQFKLKDSRN